MNNKFCVILAGGIGSRLWPSSRQALPKQFLDILGEGETLLQSTYRRYRRFIEPENIIVVTNEAYSNLVCEQLPELPANNLLLEPMRRNTVPCVVWAAFELLNRTPDALMIVTPSDQKIVDEDALQSDVMKGFDFVASHASCLSMGVEPSRQEPTFGYIQMSDQMADDIYRVQSFTEKPNAYFTKLFCESKEFLWNTGLFMWSARTFIEALRKSSPRVSVIEDKFRDFLRVRQLTSEMIDSVYEIFPNLSLEGAILEKADNIGVMQCHFQWTDVGTWNQLYEMRSGAEGGNVTIDGRTLFSDCDGCLVKLPDGKLAVLQGLTDYAVVEEGNVLMICKKDDQQAVRKFVNDLQVNGGSEYL